MSKFSGKGGLTGKMTIALWFGIQYGSQSVLEGLRLRNLKMMNTYSTPCPVVLGCWLARRSGRGIGRFLGVTVSPQTEDLFCVKSKKKKRFVLRSHPYAILSLEMAK
jgi:hypothetical protein